MLFTKLKLNYFGKFNNLEIELKPGINLIYGENEAGKSTIHTFIKGMLFGIERLRGRGAASKDDVYTRYLPWDYPGAYNGSMDIMIGDKEYRIQRSFHANDKSFNVLDLSTGREVRLKEGLISEMIPGLTESTFKNTISIEQLKAPTDAELAAQVRNYIANLSITKSKEVNVAKALSILNEQRKAFDSTQINNTLKALKSEIEDGLIREEKMDRLTEELHALSEEEKALQQEKERLSDSIDQETVRQMEQLPAILEKYRTFTDLTRQIAQLEQQRKDLKDKIIACEQEQKDAERIKDDYKEAERLKLTLLEQEKTNLELNNQEDVLVRKGKKTWFIGLFPAALLAVVILLVTGFQMFGILASVVVLAVGSALSVSINRKQNLKLDRFRDTINSFKEQKAGMQKKYDWILNQYHASGLEELAKRQEDLIKMQMTMEHSKAQLLELDIRRTDAEDNRDSIYEVIMKYMLWFTSEEELSYDSMQILQEEIHRRKNEMVGKQEDLRQRYEDCKHKMDKIRWEISNLEGNEEQLLKNKELQEQLEQKQRENEVELEAIKIALTTIQELSTDIHDTFGKQLNETVSEVIDEVTEHKYTDIKVDEKLDVKVEWNGNYIPLSKLSAGTIDQVYFALRLAVADLLLGKDEVPLILDDSFALYDESRVKTALNRISERTQVIVFSCHKREQNLLEELKIPYHLIDISCR